MQPHNIVSYTKYGVQLLKLHYYDTVSWIGVKVDAQLTLPHLEPPSEMEECK